MSKIVVSLTSWRARINNCVKVVKSVMDNTVKPDRVYLNLSIDEFGDESNLPKDLVELFENDKRLIFNWVEGNSKQYKKVFPVLQYLDDDDMVIAIDDDNLLPVDFIENRLKQFNKNGGNHPISSAMKKCHIGDTYVVSTPLVFKANMMRNWERFVDKTVMDTGNDDRTYLYVFWLNGYTTRPTDRWTKKGLDRYFPLNPVSPLKGSYIVGDRFDEAVRNKVRELTGTTIEKSFGFFRSGTDTGRHDIVLPYCHTGIASSRMTCGERLEIEYVVESVYKYCGDWMGRIFIVGDEPPKCIEDKVIHIPCDNPYCHCKDANIIHKILFAVQNIPDLSEDFIKLSDDQIVSRKTEWSDFTPRIVRRYSDWTEQRWVKNSKIDFWHKCLYLTLHRFDLHKAAFWEPHIWIPLNKVKYRNMCETFDWRKSIGCIDNTLYYNFVDQPIVEQFDHLHINDVRLIDIIDMDNLPTHISWTDKAYRVEKFRNILDKIIFEK